MPEIPFLLDSSELCLGLTLLFFVALISVAAYNSMKK